MAGWSRTAGTITTTMSGRPCRRRTFFRRHRTSLLEMDELKFGYRPARNFQKDTTMELKAGCLWLLCGRPDVPWDPITRNRCRRPVHWQAEKDASSVPETP
jgi:hypothetical protein